MVSSCYPRIGVLAAKSAQNWWPFGPWYMEYSQSKPEESTYFLTKQLLPQRWLRFEARRIPNTWKRLSVPFWHWFNAQKETSTSLQIELEQNKGDLYGRTQIS